MFDRNRHRLWYACLLILLPIVACNTHSDTALYSPNKQIKADIDATNGIQYSILLNEDTLIAPSALKIELKEFGTLQQFELIESSTKTVNTSWERVWGKRKEVQNHYNELVLHLKENKSNLLLDLYLRAYDDGVALRYGFPEQTKLTDFELLAEEANIQFKNEPTVWRANYETYVSSQEKAFLEAPLSKVDKDELIGMPLLAKVNNHAFVAITEANLTNWSGAFLKAEPKNNRLHTILTPLPSDSLVMVKTQAPALSPWRLFMISDKAAGLIESDILANLNEPATFDTSWIEAGAVAWDWWWSNKYAPDVNFELGANQQTMKYYIDFAAEMGWEYQLVDWLWYGEPFLEDGKTANHDVDITTCNPDIDIKSLVEYAHSKDVKLLVWLHWENLRDQLDEALALYEKWGVSGIKVDFMDRQDQEMVQFYHRVIKKAAEHHLLVDFHGAYKPTGVSRTYPNLITREGVMGNEYNKWENWVTAKHNVTLAFTRGLLGEMDYTPVSFNNVTPEAFKPEYETSDKVPRVQTTRAHQLATAVVFESALTIFCDAPAHYNMGVGKEFLKDIPTTWDDTKVLDAKVGEYIVIARRSGNTWYIGGLTDENARTFELDLSFLKDGEHTLHLYMDDEKTVADPKIALYKNSTLSSSKTIKIDAVGSGGFAAIIK